MVKNSRYMMPTNYGIHRWQDLFNARQQLALVTFLEKIKGTYERVLADCEAICSALALLPFASADLAQAMLGYLGVILSRQTDCTSTIARLDVTRELFQGTYARQALPMTWD